MGRGILFLAAALLAGSCSRRESAETSADVVSPEVVFERDLPEFSFEDQSGRPFGSADLKGKVWVADFIFLRCGSICPTMTANMRQLQELTADLPDVHLVTITVDPMQDSVEDLAAYAKRHEADPRRWHFLRGGVKATKDLVVKGFALGDAEDMLNHSDRFVLVDREGRARTVHDWADGTSRARLLGHLKRLSAGGEL